MSDFQYSTAEQALSVLKSGHNVFVQTASAAPQQLIRAMVENSSNLSNISIYHLHTEGIAPYTDIRYKDIFNTHCFFRQLLTSVRQ